jgi:hypothetical protein
VAGLSPANRRAIDRRRRAYLDFLRETLEQLKSEGKLKNIDVTVAAFSLFGMILWLSRWFKSSGKLTSEEIAAEIQKIALGGMLSDDKGEQKLSRKIRPKSPATNDPDNHSSASVVRLADRLPKGSKKKSTQWDAADKKKRKRR